MVTKQEIVRYVKDSIGHSGKDPKKYAWAEEKADLCICCEFPHNYKHQLLLTIKSSQEDILLHVCDNCIVDIELNSILSYEDYLDPQSSKNLRRYCKEYKFPTNTLEYINSNLCLFCDAEINFQRDGKPENYIYLPTGTTKMLVSIVPVCNQCSSYISHFNLIPTYRSLDQCVNCNSIYPITEEVMGTRDANKTLKKHYCPKCLDNIFKKSYVAKSTILMPCSICSNILEIDQTLEYNKSQYYTSNGLRCLTCKETKVNKLKKLFLNEEVEEFSVHLQGNYYLTIKFNGLLKGYRVILYEKIQGTDEYVAIFPVAYEALEDAVNYGVLTAYSYLNRDIDEIIT